MDRRNFLRFGVPDYSEVRLQSDSFFNHLDRIPIAELRGPVRRLSFKFLVLLPFIVNVFTLKEQKPQLKRARDYLRFGKREEMDTEGDEENDYIENEELNFPVKRYGRRRIANFLRFG